MFRLFYKSIFRLQFKRRFDIKLAISLKYEFYIKTLFELHPEDGFINKPKHVANMVF